MNALGGAFAEGKRKGRKRRGGKREGGEGRRWQEQESALFPLFYFFLCTVYTIQKCFLRTNSNMFLFSLLFSWERPIIRMCTRHFQSSNQRYLFVQTHTLSTSSPHPVLFESQGPYAAVLPPPFPPVSSLPHLSQTEMWRRGVGGKMRMRGVEVFSRHPQCICHDILILFTVKRRFFPQPFFQFFCTSLKTCPHGEKKSRDSLPRSHSAPKPKGRKATTTLLKQVLPPRRRVPSTSNGQIFSRVFAW